MIDPDIGTEGPELATPLTLTESQMSLVHVRIYTRCPSCHNDTLMINKGRFVCGWQACKDPTLIDRIGDLEWVQKLAEKDERIGWLEQQREVECQQKNDALNESEQCLKERDQLRAENAELRKDKERLDWLSNKQNFEQFKLCVPAIAFWNLQLRAAIDAAIK